ncbi:MAG: type II toxin-antitoxin system RelE/ParE family toxin [Spirochaetales bacterium]|nr:type II toxin-antitoxin system RelE/ParE family toxin [Spirochaetales bacterium]
MYTIFITKKAEKSILKLSKDIANKIISKIHTLRAVPFPAGCRKIVGSERDFRIRVGDYRIIYEVNQKEHQIIILTAGHRKNVYR